MKGLLFALRLHSSDHLWGLKKFSDVFSSFSNGSLPFPPGLAVSGVSSPIPPFLEPASQPETEEDKKSEGILWGVPKHRRTVEKRNTRKFGLREWHWKMYEPKYNLRICDNCGHHYQEKHLCRNCYNKNKEETKIIREKMDEQFGHSARDKDIVVLYESDKAKGLHADTTSGTAKNKLIIELSKDRPSFFSPNLLQKSTAGINEKAKDVTTTDPVPIVHKTEN